MGVVVDLVVLVVCLVVLVVLADAAAVLDALTPVIFIYP